jgi:hypothetical protein
MLIYTWVKTMTNDIEAVLDLNPEEMSKLLSSDPHVRVSDDFSLELEVPDDSGGATRMKITEWQGRQLLRKFMNLFEPEIGSLEKALHRHGYSVVKNQHIRTDGKHKLPDYPGGFYIQKDEYSQWYLGRPVNGAVYLEKCSLQDLIDLGIKVSDVKGIAVGVLYRVPFVSELRCAE